MSKTISDTLFRLVKSLTKHEKRYFKIYSSLHTVGEKNIYVSLFDAVDKQKEYNEEVLKKKFSKQASVKQFHVIKSRLYDAILKSMRVYHSDNSAEAEINGQISNIKFLREKGLLKECENAIQKAKKLAYKYELYLRVLDLLLLELVLMHFNRFIGKTEKDLTHLYDEMAIITNKYTNFLQYRQLWQRAELKMSKDGYFLRNSADEAFYRNIIHDPLMKNEKKALSYRALIIFYENYASHYFIQQKYSQAYIYNQKCVALMEANVHQIAENIVTYRFTIVQSIFLLYKNKKYNEIPLLIKKFKEIPLKISIKSESVKQRIVENSIELELDFYIHTGQFEKGMELINNIKLEFNKMYVNRIAVWYFNFSIICIGAGNYSAANKYLNKIFSMEEGKVEPVPYCFAKILSLIVHFELGNQDFLEYAVKSTYRFLYKRKKLYKLETLILDFIRKDSPKIDSDKKLKEAFKKLKSNMLNLEKDTFEKAAFDYFDIISWIESKIENRSFAEVVREKVSGK